MFLLLSVKRLRLSDAGNSKLAQILLKTFDSLVINRTAWRSGSLPQEARSVVNLTNSCIIEPSHSASDLCPVRTQEMKLSDIITNQC